MTFLPSKHLHTKSGTRVILARHGRTNYNEAGRYQGSSDESILNDTGIKTSRLTGLALDRVNLDAIYTSPLKRTRQTTSEILSAVSEFQDILPPLYSNDLLKEIDLYGWEGLPFDYVKERFPREYHLWKEHPHQFSIEQRFPVLELYERAEMFWQEILPRHVGQTILVVSHGGTIRALIGTAVDLLPDRFHVLQQSNCGISSLYFPGGRDLARLEALNSTTHLGEVLPKLKEGKQGLRLLLIPQTDKTDAMQIEKLGKSLQQESIDFCLSSEDANCDRIARSILQYHRQSVHLQVASENFPKIWHQTIRAKAANYSNQLINGLVIASSSTLEHLLFEVLGANPAANFNFDSGMMSVIHYPRRDRLPILQSIEKF